jgi:uncharacterized protein
MDVANVYPDKRLVFVQDEASHPWLSLLLDAYSVVDQGVAEGIAQEVSNGSRTLACTKGCANCCRIHADVPVYPLELAGMYWYSTEQVHGAQRNMLITQLAQFEEGAPCPFLVNDICAVHPLRPMSCRQFNVFDVACAQNEDPYYTRRQDVFTPLDAYTDNAFWLTLPFYGIVNDLDKEVAIKEKHIHRQVRVLQKCNWVQLAEKMRGFDAQKEL